MEVSARAATPATVAMASDMAMMVVPIGTDSVDETVSDADVPFLMNASTDFASAGLTAVVSAVVVVLQRQRMRRCCVEKSLSTSRRMMDDEAERSEVN